MRQVLSLTLSVLLLASCGASGFYEWIDRASVLDDLKPKEDELLTSSFLQYVIDPRASMVENDCDGSFDCSQFHSEEQDTGGEPVPDEYYKPAAQPKRITFPTGRIPRQAKCYIKCDYTQSYTFNVGSMVPVDSESSTMDLPQHHATKARAKSHAHHNHAAASFLETESTVDPVADAVPIDNVGSPFHCQTVCDFPQPKFCNPVRRMIVGSAGFTPQEHTCCDLCEARCRSKTIIERFRVCYLGCRAFCPFV